ncbi:MAG: anhydro-N-acetylmuramic acid kinase [Leptolyngbyaceae cyanobacterium CRU_2_3]|nr:anhydro-N-acetylmuramic acid kinase [Leptolyngbyaceae cyanobacterium CRU_2_3]
MINQRVIGLISGTSVDGIDAALVEICGSQQSLKVNLLAGNTYAYPAALRSQILSICGGAPISMAEFAALDDAIAQEFAKAAIAIQAGHPPASLIGSHGQTVFHRPLAAREIAARQSGVAPLGYSLQLGRGALIAHLTGTTTISNFRVADIAAGGQGAPLVSPVDACLLSHATDHRCVQNIGGIGNVTYLPATGLPSTGLPSTDLPAMGSSVVAPKILGWDTGPGNTLLDLAVHRLSDGKLAFDAEGAWAAQGTPCQDLVQQWLQQDFFQQPPPKSTGREWFGQAYLERCLAESAPYSLTPADILSTLTELTAASIAHSYRTFLPQMPNQVFLCGGGSHNLYLKHRIQANLERASVYTTDEVGLNSNYKEAIAFAVLAYWRNWGIPGNLPEVTGAQQPALLGEINLVVRSTQD